MSTTTATLSRGSVQNVRAALAGALAASLLAAAALVALNAGPTGAGSAQQTFTDAQIERSLIDVRAGERVGAGVPTAAYWAQFRADEQEMR